MSRDYVKMEEMSEEVFRRKAQGETNRANGESYGLSLEQIRNLVKRQNRKRRQIAPGSIRRISMSPPPYPQNLRYSSSALADGYST